MRSVSHNYMIVSLIINIDTGYYRQIQILQLEEELTIVIKDVVRMSLS